MKTSIHIFDYNDLPDTEWYLHDYLGDMFQNDCLKWYFLDYADEGDDSAEKMNAWLREQGVEGDKVLIDICW